MEHEKLMGKSNNPSAHYRSKSVADDGPFVFDQVMDSRAPKGQMYNRKTDLEPTKMKNAEKQYGYTHKTKRDGIWAAQVKPREWPKASFKVPLTTSQQIGWKEPIDNLTAMNKTSHNLVNTCKRTFYGH